MHHNVRSSLRTKYGDKTDSKNRTTPVKETSASKRTKLIEDQVRRQDGQQEQENANDDCTPFARLQFAIDKRLLLGDGVVAADTAATSTGRRVETVGDPNVDAAQRQEAREEVRGVRICEVI